MPTAAATVRAPSSSPVARAGETAVTANTRSPNTRAAAAATSDESTPPENATSALGAVAIAASSSASVGIEVSCRRGRGERFGPDLLDGSARRGGDGGAVVVLGGDVDNAVVEEPYLDPHGVAVDVDLSDGTVELVSLEPLDANAQRRRVRQERLGERAFVLRAAEDTQHDA